MNQWVVPKRRETWPVVIYSIVGFIVVMGLVTLLNYAFYANAIPKQY